VASAGPYANHLHHTLRQVTMPVPHQSSLNILWAGCSSWRPTNGVKALKASETEMQYILQHAIMAHCKTCDTMRSELKLKSDG